MTSMTEAASAFLRSYASDSLDDVAANLRRSLAEFYGVRDQLDLLWKKDQEGPVTLKERIAFALVRQELTDAIASCQRRLSKIARRGGHGHQVVGGNS